MRLTIEQLQAFADEINRDWHSYTAEVGERLERGHALFVYDSKERVLTLTEEGKIFHCDKNAADQVVNMLNR